MIEVGPNVLRMQLPMSQFTGLGHVNAYALLDSRGAAIIDPGLPGPPTWNAIQDRLKKADVGRTQHPHGDRHPLASRPLRRRRQAGQGGRRRTRHPLGVPHVVEERRTTATRSTTSTPRTSATRSPWGSNPWGGTNFKPPLKRRMMFRLMRSGLMRNRIVPANPTVRLKDGDVIKLAGREFFAVHTPGHTIDHLCLHDPEGGLLFSGDHVLPTITPHIAGVGGGRDPLKLFKDSLDKVAALPGVDKVLPAHGHPFADLPGRVDAIKAHHDERCDKLREVSKALGPTTVTELSHHLFRKERWGGMAESETYAHLEHLRLDNQAECYEENGQLIYTVA